MRDAVMAAEDRDFYSNPGFSFTGFLRAFKNNIFGGDVQGGSTITQQYVKNALVGSERSGLGGVTRKAKELVISTKMSSEWSKDQVLQSYLNIIYFGRGAYGVAAAANAYFGKPVEQLTVAESALLAALIQRPSTLDPAVDPDGAAERWNWVLDGMVEIGALSADRPGRSGVPADGAAGAGARAEPDHRAQRADRAPGHQGTAGTVRHRRADAEHRGPADHHDHRPEGAEGRRGGGHREPGRPGSRHALGGGVDRPEDRRGQGLLRRFGRQRLRLRAGGSADRFVVQGVRADRRAAAGDRPGLSGRQLAGERQRHRDQQRRGQQLRHLQHRRGAQAVAEHQLLPADAEAEERPAGRRRRRAPGRHRGEHPRRRAHPERGRPGRPARTTASCWGSTRPGCSTWRRRTRRSPRRGSTASRTSCRRWSTPRARCSSTPRRRATTASSASTRTSPTTSSRRCSRSRVTPTATTWPAGGRRRPRPAPYQLGDTGDNRDAWMVGFTPSLSTAVWVGTTEGTKPLAEPSGGSAIYGSGLPSDIWKETMDGALEDTDNETFPKPEEIGGYAGVPQAPPPPPSTAPPTPSMTRHPADHRGRAGHHDPDRPADHRPDRSARAGRAARAGCARTAAPVRVHRHRCRTRARPFRRRRALQGFPASHRLRDGRRPRDGRRDLRARRRRRVPGAAGR